ncbi:MAG: penicillin acylase family protein [Pseudomonadota bacterium]
MPGSRMLFIVAATLLLAGCTTSPNRWDGSVQIRWTEYGIPHIRANDYFGAGYGLAYAVATDTICVLAEEILTVRGERSQYLGNTSANRDSDVFYRALLGPEKLAAVTSASLPGNRSLLRGYVAGYNRFLNDKAIDLPASCKGAAWVKPMDESDVARLAIGVGIRYGLGRFMTQIANADPQRPTGSTVAFNYQPAELPADGSNALAFGSATTATGRGILLGNPHYPWHGGSRFHLAHMTIPGTLDVMGAGLITTPRIAIGFTKDVAWTHTVSTALRFTLFRLELAGDRMTYRVGNATKPIQSVRVVIDTPDGPHERLVYLTEFGPVVQTADTPWDDNFVYALRDVNYENYRSGNQYHELDRAKNVSEIRESLARYQGAAFVNTLAADRDGKVLYADMSAIPYVTKEQIERCQTGLERVLRRRVVVLNGSDPSCNWQTDKTAAAPGLMPPLQQPSLVTDTFVSNSNDSHWLSNPDIRLEGYSPIIGDEGTPRSLRTRAGLAFIDEIFARGEKLTPAAVQDILFSHRHYGAETFLDDFLTICDTSEPPPDVRSACGILRNWDRRTDVNSVGAQIYNELWFAIANDLPGHLTRPFDINDPVRTPAGLDVSSKATRDLVINGLTLALKRLHNAGVSPAAPWGEVQFAERNGDKIGIPGGQGGAGVYSVITASLDEDAGGYNPIVHGNSYIQVVTWNEDGTPDAKAILTYSQSPEPDSPYYADQTRLYSKSQWIKLPFTDEEIESQLIRAIELNYADSE